MPKVKIVERDLTGSLQLGTESNIVYIPGCGTEETKPFLVNSIYELEENEYYKEEKIDKTDLSYKLMRRLLQLGMPVLYQLFTASSSEDSYVVGKFTTLIEDNKFTINDVEYTIGENEVTSEGSETALPIVNGEVELETVEIEQEQVKVVALIDFVHNIVEYNVRKKAQHSLNNITADVWKVLQDRSIYDVRFLTAGGHPEAVNAADMLNCATMRGDCVALIDHEKELTDSGVSAVRAFFNALGGNIVRKEIFGNISELETSAFGAGFTPWFKTEPGTLDEESIEVPASFGYLFAYARMIQNAPSWWAAAGSFRGLIPELKEPLKQYTNAEVEILQGRASDYEVELDEPYDNVGIAINPIALVNPFGYIVWGNRTLITNEPDSNSVGNLKATSFLNVRNCISLINKKAYDASRKYTFEQNSDVLWLNFKAEITPLLDQMQTNRGILGYRIDRVETNKRARVGAKIRIIPIEGVEDYEIEIDLQNSLSE